MLTPLRRAPLAAAAAGLLALLAGCAAAPDELDPERNPAGASLATDGDQGSGGGAAPTASRRPRTEPAPEPPPSLDSPPLSAGALPGREPEDRVLAVVDGREIGADQVVHTLFLTRTQMIFSALEHAIRGELVRREAERLGVVVREGDLEREMASVLERQNAEYQLAAGPNRSFEAFIQAQYGVTPEAYREAVRRQVLEELFLSRLVRFEARGLERMRVRVIVTEDFDLAREIQRKLEEGASFPTLARTHSVDRSAAGGGLFPPVAVDCPNPFFQGLAALPEGAFAEITPLVEGGVRLYRIARIEERIPADPRPYLEQEGDLLVELQDQPLDPLELLEWDRRVRERHRIEVRLGRP